MVYLQEQEQELLKKNNAQEVFQKQDESHLYVAPTRRTYEMFLDWKPEPVTWAVKLKASQHRVKPEQFTDYIIAEFIRKNIGEESKTEHKWQDYLMEAVIRGYIKPEGQEPKPTNQQKQPEITPPVYKNWSDEPSPPPRRPMTPEQLAGLRAIRGEK